MTARQTQDQRDERDDQRDNNATEMRVEMRYLRQDVKDIKEELKIFTATNMESRIKALEFARQADVDNRKKERQEIRQAIFNTAVGVVTLIIGGFITLYLSHFGSGK